MYVQKFSGGSPSEPAQTQAERNGLASIHRNRGDCSCVLFTASGRARNHPSAVRRYGKDIENVLGGYLAAVSSVCFHATEKIRHTFECAKNQIAIGQEMRRILVLS